MADQTLNCPNCGKKIKITEAFTLPIEEKLRKEMGKEFESKFDREKSKLERLAFRQAKDSLATELADLQEQLDEKSTALAAAQKAELKLRKRERELSDKEKSLELDTARKLAQETEKIWNEAKSRLAEEHRFKDGEKDLQLAQMRKQIEELKQKAEQGSQQTQGEVLELELENILRSTFPSDQIAPVAKGVKGGDIVHKVFLSGQECGAILWESKRTKTWSEGWIQKLKDDQRSCGAVVAVLVSIALPKQVNRFGSVEGVWVSDFGSAMGLAMALREHLIQLAQIQTAMVGKNEKMELMYEYLSGAGFRARFQAIVESFVLMKDDLETERRAMERSWAKREKQIQRVIKNTAGMHGDLEGIIGAALPSMQILELPSGEAFEASPIDDLQA